MFGNTERVWKPIIPYQEIVGEIVFDEQGKMWQDIAIIKIHYPSMEKVFEYIAMGLVYEYCGKIPVDTKFPIRRVAGMEIATEEDIMKTLSCVAEPPFLKIFDNNKYNGDVQYAILYSPDIVLVYLTFYKSTLYKTLNTQCRVIAVSFKENNLGFPGRITTNIMIYTGRGVHVK